MMDDSSAEIVGLRFDGISEIEIIEYFMKKQKRAV
jgi:hypothetical protein